MVNDQRTSLTLPLFAFSYNVIRNRFSLIHPCNCSPQPYVLHEVQDTMKVD